MIQNQIMKYISASLEIEKLMNIITESVEKEIGVDVCAITLFPGTVENRRKLQLKAVIQYFQKIVYYPL